MRTEARPPVRCAVGGVTDPVPADALLSSARDRSCRDPISESRCWSVTRLTIGGATAGHARLPGTTVSTIANGKLTLDPDGAAAYLKQLTAARRYVRDAYSSAARRRTGDPASHRKLLAANHRFWMARHTEYRPASAIACRPRTAGLPRSAS